jgi:hypothetical protein
MKNIFFIICSLFMSANALSAQNYTYTGALGEQDWTRMWTNYRPNELNYYSTTSVIPAVIDHNLTLTKGNTYLLQGIVYVINNAVLTIEPGTVIRGDYSSSGTLVITKGCKLMAVGTESNPIVFTSNKSIGEKKPGDWGGIIILGDAPVNKIAGVGMIEWGIDTRYAQYGGSNENDLSGELKYVRIEYPGKKLNLDQELNGLTLAGVGKATVIENVEVSYSNDDSFEIFGGNLNLKNLISYRCTDDDFDFNYGYNGTLQFSIAVRHPLITDFSGSRCVEADSYSGAVSTMDPTRKLTNVNLDHLTFVVADANNADAFVASEAIYIGKSCSVSIANSIVSGFNVLISNKGDSFKDKIVTNQIIAKGNVLNKVNSPITSDLYAAEVNIYLLAPAQENTMLNSPVTDLFVNPLNRNYPDFKVKVKDLSSVK